MKLDVSKIEDIVLRDLIISELAVLINKVESLERSNADWKIFWQTR